MPPEPPAISDFAAPPEGGVDLLFIAGEHSGDEHAAEVLADLRKAHPELRVACLGGEALASAGAQLLYDLTAVSIVGFVEVARHYGFFKDLFDRTIAWIERYRPRHICFVDYPGLNLRIAAELKKRGLSRKGGGAIGLSFYIGPQVWAWKAKRRFKMAQTLDRLGVIFPFEVECFADTGLPVEFVGHPFVRAAYEPPFRREPGAPVLLLPGSRKAAVGRIFPVLVKSFVAARRQLPDLRATVVYPSEGIRAVLDSVLAGYTSDEIEGIALVRNSGEQRAASAVLMSSGTMSLACALSAIPGAIVYRLNPLSYWIGRMVIKIPYLGIANILLDRPLHPEFIQGAAQADRLANELVAAAARPERAAEAGDAAVELRDLLDAGSEASAAEWLARGMGLDES